MPTAAQAPPALPQTSLRDAKKHATSRELAAAAYALARSHGMDGFTIEDVVARAGYSRRTFANHFSCKQEAVVEGFLHRLGLPLDPAEIASAGLATLGDVIDLSEREVTRILTADNLAELRAFGLLLETNEPLRPFVLDGMQRLRTTGPLATLADRFPAQTLALLFGAILGIVGSVLESVMDPAACGPRGRPTTSPAGDSASGPDLAAMTAMLARGFDHLRHGFLPR